MRNQRSTAEPAVTPPFRSLDRLLLDEANHRVANEVAAALAAMTLARSARGEAAKERLLSTAVARLEGFGETARLLASSGMGEADAGPMVDRICRASLPAGGDPGPARVVLDLAPCPVPGETARRIAMIAHELVTNARKHAFRDPGGELLVRLQALSGALVLTVSDDGPGIAASGGRTGDGGLGSRIVSDVVAHSGGFIECDTGPHGTAIHVSLPIG